MRFCADSSALLALYLNTERLPAIERFLADGAKAISISELARVETLNVLLRDRSTGVAERFEADVSEGLRIRLESVDWEDVFSQAESLARRFSRGLRPEGHNLVLVSAAVTMGASWFLSFDRDSRQRPLASVAGLQVWPPLDKNEKGLVRHVSRNQND